MELLIPSVPSILAAALAAVVLVLTCRALMALGRFVPHGRTLVGGTFVAGNILGPICFQLWIEGLDVDGPAGLAIFMAWVFIWATALLSLALVAGSMMERRPGRSRQLRRSWN